MDPTAPNNPNSPNSPNSDPGPVTTEPVVPSSTPAPDPSGSMAPPADPPKRDVYATSLDPNDPLASSAQPGPLPADSSIQTGQFVVAGGDQAPPPQNFQPEPAAPPPPPPYIPQEPNAAVPQAPAPGPQLAPAFAPTAQQFQQPDPTPYAPPPPTPGSQQVSAGGGSMIKKLRLVAILAGILVLLGAIGALVWFFVLGRSSQQPTQTQATTQETQAVVEEATPLPRRTEGGFGTLPGLQSTSSAQVATPSAQ